MALMVERMEEMSEERESVRPAMVILFWKTVWVLGTLEIGNDFEREVNLSCAIEECLQVWCRARILF